MKIEQYFDKKLGKKRWRFDVTVGGTRYRESGIRTRAKCEEIIDELRLDFRLIKRGLKEKATTVTLQDLAAARLADPLCRQSQVLKRALQAFAEVAPATTLAKDLNETHFRALVTLLHGRELMGGTINTYLAALSTMLRSAPQYFSELRQHQWPKLPWLPPDEGRTRVLSVDEISKILCALLLPKQPFESQESYDHRDDVGDAIRLALLLGARENELLKLTATDLNWDWLTVKVYSTKTKRSRILPLCPLAVKIIKPRSQTERLFNGFNDDALQRWCAAAGDRAGVIWGQEVENGWTFHDLRRTAATVLEEHGTPYSVVSAFLGHKRRDQTATYTIARQHQLRDAAHTLGNWCQEIVGFNLHFRGSINSINNLKTLSGG